MLNFVKDRERLLKSGESEASWSPESNVECPKLVWRISGGRASGRMSDWVVWKTAVLGSLAFIMCFRTWSSGEENRFSRLASDYEAVPAHAGTGGIGGQGRFRFCRPVSILAMRQSVDCWNELLTKEMLLSTMFLVTSG